METKYVVIVDDANQGKRIDSTHEQDRTAARKRAAEVEGRVAQLSQEEIDNHY